MSKSEAKPETQKPEEAVQAKQGDVKEDPVKKRDVVIHDLTDTLKRLQAEFDNFRKRLAQEQAQQDIARQAATLKKFLPVLDTFEQSLKSLNGHCKKDDPLLKGMELVYAQLYAVLEEQGVRPITINIQKEKVDPYKHEVLMTIPSPLPEHTILEEFQKGYYLNNLILRTAKVKCAKGEHHESKDAAPQ